MVFKALMIGQSLHTNMDGFNGGSHICSYMFQNFFWGHAPIDPQSISMLHKLIVLFTINVLYNYVHASVLDRRASYLLLTPSL